MSQSDKWRYCRDSLREKVRQGDAMQMPVSSTYVISRLKEEEVEMQIAPSIVSINALVAGKAKGRAFNSGNVETPNAYAAGPSGQSPYQNGRKNDKGNQRQARRPAPYNSQQRGPRPVCENAFCETPVGHSKADCFSYGGGKVGKYPENFRGRKDVHLAPEARIAARRKQALEANSGSGSRFAGMVETTDDGDDKVNAILGGVADGFAFMLDTLGDTEDEDDIHIDEEIHVNAAVLRATSSIAENSSMIMSSSTHR
ncbi:hypothetical protein K438DRAFT_1816406 [Mycena galopus ATCC 62051]|nr:hypothetical protein K438DRAFT_1816406 [Mycena galopus ATCC 62051]